MAPPTAAVRGGYVGNTRAVSSKSGAVARSRERLSLRAGPLAASATAFGLAHLNAIEPRDILIGPNVVGTATSGDEMVGQDATAHDYIPQDIRPIATCQASASRNRVEMS